MGTANYMVSETYDKVIHTDAAWSDVVVACLAGHITVESGVPCLWLEKTYSPSPIQAGAQDLLEAITLATTLGWRRITLKTDAQIVAQAMNAIRELPWGIKHKLRDRLSLLAHFDCWSVVWIIVGIVTN